MGRALLRRIKQARPPETPADEAMVSLMLASSWLNARLEEALAETGLSMPQYNVLRILAGAHPGGHPRCEVARRMIDRAPDVTRLVDRLESRRLVERGPCPEDGRRSIARITPAGLALVQQATAALRPVEAEVAGRLTLAEQRDLARLCEALFGPDVE